MSPNSLAKWKHSSTAETAPDPKTPPPRYRQQESADTFIATPRDMLAASLHVNRHNIKPIVFAMAYR